LEGWKRRLDDLRERYGAAMDLTRTALQSFHQLRLACEAEAGPALDWELDVIPAMAKVADSFHGRGQLMRTWTPLLEDAAELRDRRLANGNAQTARSGSRRGDRGVKLDAKQERLVADLRAHGLDADADAFLQALAAAPPKGKGGMSGARDRLAAVRAAQAALDAANEGGGP
jgi:hypothetical protein